MEWERGKRKEKEKKKKVDAKISESVVYWYFVPGLPKIIPVIF